MWGFACAGHNPGPEFLDAMKYAWLTEGQTYVVSECANLLWSFSAMKEHPGTDVLRVLEVRPDQS